jgi:hypothetical protein
MPDTTLIRGPYTSPGLTPGEVVTCEVRGKVKASGMSDAPIPWPVSTGRGRRRLPIVTGDLSRAIRTESVWAVAYHWGVSRRTACRWRESLGVERHNPGTEAVYKRHGKRRMEIYDAFRTR